jgi:hypothetical protein
MSAYIVYEPENIIGGGSDTVIRGVYLSFDEAMTSAQDSADRDTFQDWLDLERTCKYPYNEGYRDVSYLSELKIMKVPLGAQINEPMDAITSVVATYKNLFIQNHPRFDEYKKHFDIRIAKINERNARNM